MFEEPDTFRLDRDDPRAGISGFGGGPHVCPGAALARSRRASW